MLDVQFTQRSSEFNVNASNNINVLLPFLPLVFFFFFKQGLFEWSIVILSEFLFVAKSFHYKGQSEEYIQDISSYATTENQGNFTIHQE